MTAPLTIATRGSALALWQANHVKARLEALDPSREVRLLVLRTTGDRVQDRPLAEIGGKGLFVKEIEEALLDGRADLAVHSMKDLPAALPDGLEVAAVPERDDPRDAFCSPTYARLADLPAGAVVGTSSVRRQAQLLDRFPRLTVEPLRGNVDTRLRRLNEGRYAGIILAMAGLSRLGLLAQVREPLPLDVSLPAIGQGALAVEARVGSRGAEAARALEHEESRLTTTAERAVLAAVGGDCRMPLAAHAVLEGGRLRLRALIASPDGRRVVRHEAVGAASAPEALGREVAAALLEKGADIVRGLRP
ncbi:MAG TPA: hydroxymethylbilane synthase [Thermodesulfobacteriota bacterium]